MHMATHCPFSLGALQASKSGLPHYPVLQGQALSRASSRELCKMQSCTVTSWASMEDSLNTIGSPMSASRLRNATKPTASSRHTFLTTDGHVPFATDSWMWASKPSARAVIQPTPGKDRNPSVTLLPAENLHGLPQDRTDSPRQSVSRQISTRSNTIQSQEVTPNVLTAPIRLADARRSPPPRTDVWKWPSSWQSSVAGRREGSVGGLPMRQSSVGSSVSSASGRVCMRSASFTCPMHVAERAVSPVRASRHQSPRHGIVSPPALVRSPSPRPTPMLRSASPSAALPSSPVRATASRPAAMPAAVATTLTLPPSSVANLVTSPVHAQRFSTPQWAYAQPSRPMSPTKLAQTSRPASPTVQMLARTPGAPPYVCPPKFVTPTRAPSSPLPLAVKSPGRATPAPLMSTTSTAASLSGPGSSSVSQPRPAAIRVPLGPTPHERGEGPASARPGASSTSSTCNASDASDSEGKDILKAMLSSVEAIERQLTDGVLGGELSSVPSAPHQDASAGSYAPWFGGRRHATRPIADRAGAAEDTIESSGQPDLETYVSWLKTIRSETEVETKRFREAFFNSKGFAGQKVQDSQLPLQGEAASIARVFANAIFSGNGKRGAPGSPTMQKGAGHDDSLFSTTDSFLVGDQEQRPHARIPAIIEDDSTASGDASIKAHCQTSAASSGSGGAAFRREHNDRHEEICAKPNGPPLSEVALLNEVSDLKRALQNEVRQRDARSEMAPPDLRYFASDISSVANSDDREEQNEAELRERLEEVCRRRELECLPNDLVSRDLVERCHDKILSNQCSGNDERFREVRLSSDDEDEPRNLDQTVELRAAGSLVLNLDNAWSSSSVKAMEARRSPSPQKIRVRKQYIHAIEAV